MFIFLMVLSWVLGGFEWQLEFRGGFEKWQLLSGSISVRLLSLSRTFQGDPSPLLAYVSWASLVVGVP